MRNSENKVHRVVVTGLGCLTPVGHGKDAYFEALIAGVSGAGPITHFDPSDITTKIAAQINDFVPDDFMDKKAAKRMDRFSQFGVAASRMAMEDSKLERGVYDPYREGIILGTGIGGIATIEDSMRTLIGRGPSRMSPFCIPMLIPNMVSGMVSIELGLMGSSLSVSTACSSATHAIGEAYRMIKHGYLDMALAGGVEAAVTSLAVSGFAAMKAMSTRNDDPKGAMRPFDKTRDGFVMGEGGGVLVLESLEGALKRGAHIYGEVLGYGSTSDAFHMTAPDENATGASKAMELTLEEAGLEPSEIDYLNAHGTSTPMNDRLETLAIHKVFGDAARDLTISSTKSMTGHLLGGAGGIEAIACLQVIQTGKVPPTINYNEPDEDCDLFYVPNHSIEKKVRYTLSNTLGFGGHNGCIALGEYKE